jgi:hypothetical protein
MLYNQPVYTWLSFLSLIMAINTVKYFLSNYWIDNVKTKNRKMIYRYKINTLLCTRYAMKTYSNLYGNNMVLFFFQYEIDFFYPYFQEIFFILELNRIFNIYKLQKHVLLRHQSYLIVFMGNKYLRLWQIMPL